MARASLRRYDVQAKVALVVSILAVLGFLALISLAGTRYNSEMAVVVYGKKSIFLPVFMVGTALTLLLCAIGAAMGANSAGQKRNHLSKHSWLAFILGLAAMSATLILFFAFWINKCPVG